MKHLIYLIITLLLFTTIKAQPFTIDYNFAPTYSFWDGGSYYGTPVINSIIERDDGKIYIGGKFQDLSDNYLICNIAMLHSDGSLNTNFQPFTIPDLSSSRLYFFNDTIYSIYNYGLARHDGNTGDFDWDYDDTIASEIGGNRSDIEIFDDGTMFIAIDGFYHSGTPEFYHFWLGKLKPSGHLDTTFHHSPNYYVNEITRYDNERLLLHGAFTQYDNLNVYNSCRIYNDGTIDTSYHNIFSWGWVKPSYIQPDGKIIVTGYFTLIGSNNVISLIRLNSDGSLDSTFNNFNNFQYPDSNAILTIGNIGSVVPTPNGKLLIGSYFEWYQGYPRGCIVLTDSNGFIDTTAFNGSGFTLNRDTTSAPWAKVIIPGQNDTYYIGGSFSEFNGEPVKPIIRILGHTWGIEEPADNILSVKVYPNPASTHTTFEWDFPTLEESVNLTITDVSGKPVKSYIIRTKQGQILWDTRNIKNGIYLYSVLSGEKVLSSGKLIISK